MNRSILIALTAAFFVGAPIQAQQTFFGEDTDGTEGSRATLVNSVAAENLFLAQLSGVGTETFEGFTSGTLPPLGITFPGAGTATLTGSGGVASQGPGTNSVGRYPISGTRYWEANANGGFGINFSAPVAAFGFYGVDIGDFGGSLSLSFLNTSNVWVPVPVNHVVGSNGSTGGDVFYFGYINTANPFTQVAFNLTEGPQNDVFAFDNMTIGSVEQVVPEPATVLLLGTGLMGIGFTAYRRRKEEE